MKLLHNTKFQLFENILGILERLSKWHQAKICRKLPPPPLPTPQLPQLLNIHGMTGTAVNLSCDCYYYDYYYYYYSCCVLARL